MASRTAWFAAGFVTASIVLGGGAYLFVACGGISMATSAAPLPFERHIAKIALHASVANAVDHKDPLPFDDANMVAGAQVYIGNCAGCHGVPGQRKKTTIAAGMFPDPPQLFDSQEMVTDDPEGVTFWKVTHGIRLSGMPAFESTLSESVRWQVTMLVAHADKSLPVVQAVLASE